MTGTVQTVLGPVSATVLGFTLMHEHVFVDLSCNFIPPEEASLRRYADAPVTIDILGLLRKRPVSICRANVRLDDEELAIEELSSFYREGGGTLVDCTVLGIGRDPHGLQRVSRATGVHIVAGTGLYVESAHPEWVRDRSIEELADIFIREIVDGIGNTDVRAGIIGEIGTSGVVRGAAKTAKRGHATPQEEKVLRAAARASLATGAAVTIHTDRRGQGALYIVDLLESEGLAPDRIIIGHMDTVGDHNYHKCVAARGVFVQYDTWGREYYQEEIGVAWRSDVRRCEFLTAMLDAGYEDQMLLSQDVCFKIDLSRYGGYGYAHLLRSGIPMLKRHGVTDDQIRKLTVVNPMKALSVVTLG